MSNVPGISPITPDIEEIRHSEDDGFFGDERDEDIAREDEPDDDGEGRTGGDRDAAGKRGG